MAPEARITVFLGDFDSQLQQIAQIYAVLEKRLQSFNRNPASPEMVDSTGYQLHNLYCAYEDLFKLVVGFWENNVSSNGGFHINILKRMMAEIEGVRPPLISAESYSHLDELRGFRHVFRHAYTYHLDDERVGFLLRRVIAHKECVLTDINAFRDKIRNLVK
ncbi:MAG: hypothetical protein ABIL58_28125 [Pseudomonadota bacterium]